MSPSLSRSFMDPKLVISHFHIHPGDVIADFGAGSGFYVKALSEAVGPGGSVYACEIQKGLLDKLAAKARDERLGNVHAVWCDLEAPQGTKMRDGLLDSGILMNTLFQIEKRDVALREIARVIRRGGVLFVVDWTDSFGGIGPHPSQVVTAEQAKALAASAGFTFDRTFPAADHHYGLAFRRT